MSRAETTINAYRAVLVDQISVLATASMELEATQDMLHQLRKEYALRFSESDCPSPHGDLESELQHSESVREGLAQELADCTEEVARLTADLEESRRLHTETQGLYNRAVAERGEQSDKVAELMLTVENLRQPQFDYSGALEKTVAERDEARAALKRAETARRTAEKSERSALADMEKLEKQLSSTIGKLQEEQAAHVAVRESTRKQEEEIDQLRSANLALTEQARNVSAPDLTTLRSLIDATSKWLEKDEPEKTARALSAVLQELNRLEGK
jgi:chromosome segregation ATPase